MDATVEVALTNPLGRAVEASVTVHDLGGRRVATLLAGFAAPGLTTLRWAGRDPEGRAAPPGIYHVRAGIAGSIRWQRFALVR